MNMDNKEVYAVLAVETGGQVDGAGEPVDDAGCYCICNTRETAQAVIDKDTRDGHIHPGATVELHVIQTLDMV